MINKRKNILEKLRLRVIDLLGIFLVISALFTLAFFFLRKGETIDVVIRMSEGDYVNRPWEQQLPLWYTDFLQIGMAQYDSFGKKTIEIIDKKIYPSGQEYRVVDVTLRMRVVYNKRTNQYLYAGDRILIGASQKFPLGPYMIRGLIRDVNNIAQYKTKEYLIKGQLSPLQNNMSIYGWGGSFSGTPNTTGVPNFLADSIHKGDEIRDSKNRILVSVLSVEKKPAVFVLADAMPYRIVDDRNTEVNVDLQLLGETIADKPMYLGISPIVVNSTIWLHFSDKTLVVVLTDVKEAPSNDKKKE